MVSGDPDLSPRTPLLPASVTGRILRLSGLGRAEIDLGAHRGIRNGQQLWVVAPDRKLPFGTVTEVSEERSILTADAYGIPYAVGYRVVGRTVPEAE
jgi:hypothetical protein